MCICSHFSSNSVVFASAFVLVPACLKKACCSFCLLVLWQPVKQTWLVALCGGGINGGWRKLRLVGMFLAPGMVSGCLMTTWGGCPWMTGRMNSFQCQGHSTTSSVAAQQKAQALNANNSWGAWAKFIICQWLAWRWQWCQWLACRRQKCKQYGAMPPDAWKLPGKKEEVW